MSKNQGKSTTSRRKKAPSLPEETVKEDSVREEELMDLSDRLAKMYGAVSNMNTAVMMIDRDLVITYANNATIELLKKNAEELSTLYPGFDVDELVGTCIDSWHKNPERQRNLLADSRNLPYKADIQIGSLTFRIQVSAIFDRKGAYVGNTLEWNDVTEQRKKENDVMRLQTAVNGAGVAMMMIDRDFVVTYINDATRKLFERRREEMERLYPGFDPSKIVGMCIDDFHKHPSHQRRLLEDPRKLPYKTDIKVGELRFALNVTAVHDTEGNYVGNAMEWEDVTEQRDAQNQVEQLIASAVKGELDVRIDASNYTGFMGDLGTGINRLFDAVVMPIREVKKVAGRLADGDLTAKMEGDFEGEFKSLQDSLNTSIDHLRSTVLNINAAANAITGSADDISEGNTDLSQRTQEQASALEETASTMEEMTGSVRQNAAYAKEANQLAVDARSLAEKGGKVVGTAVDAMEEINSSSKKISDIIGVIEQIAFQTNMLALNAAVEAARAGDQGRGFAVVAGEVRSLAQRSSTAARDIKRLIEDSVFRVDDGTRLVDQSGETLQEIMSAVKKVSDIIGEIAAAGEEQANGIEQVNQAISQMDRSTQQNAALVEEAASASESMSEQSANLVKLMQFFTTGDSSQERAKVLPTPVFESKAVRKRAEPKRSVLEAPQQSMLESTEWEEF